MAVSERGPRERMVFSAAQLIRRDGVASTGMREVAVTAAAPVSYTHLTLPTN